MSGNQINDREMRRSILFLMAAAVLAATSCTKESDVKIDSEKELVTMSFDATIGNPTKTELGESNGVGGYKVLWSKGDAIAILPSLSSATTGSTQPIQFDTDVQAAVLSATFTGAIASPENYDRFYSIYPYSAADYWSEKYDNIVVNLSANQKANGIASGIAVATAIEGNLDFEHVTGLVKFTIPAEYTKIKEVKLKGKDSTPLAGQYYVYRDGVTASKFGDSKFAEVTLTPAEGEVFTPGSYYFTAFPATLSGFTLSFVDTEDKVAKKSTDKSLIIEAGHIMNLGIMNGLSFESVIPAISDGSYAVLAKLNDDYYYLTNEDTGNSTKRLAAEVSGYAELPSSLTDVDPTYVWNLTYDSGGYIMTDCESMSLSHKSDNSAFVSSESEDRVSVTIDNNGDGTYSMYYTAADGERYLSMYNTGAYFVFYKLGVNSALYDLYLVPAVADTDPKITVVNTNDPTGISATGGVLNGSFDGYNLDGAEITVGFDVNGNSYTAVLEGNTFTYSIDGLTTQSYTYKAWVSLDAGLTKVYGVEKTITPESPVETASVEFVLTGLFSDDTSVTELSDSPINLAFAKATNKNNEPKYYKSDQTLRMYVNNTVTISGAVIRSVEFTAKSNAYCKNFTSQIGVCSTTEPTCLWEGKSEEVVLTASGTGRWTKIVVTYEVQNN